ncbi:hypothetical protein G5I_09167 [Acromyrmex echinatior]|uniref:Uncharacterized protein n=1 Tax=Acromyrmex echinatior TaxID=103372 RepID=F4WTG9_ACREC|nr:hypothetical protein G5I_09167 [Acromyrmex echinatior]
MGTIIVQLALPRDAASYDSIVSETHKSHIPRRVLPLARIEESSSLSSSIIGTVWLNEFQLSKLGSVAMNGPETARRARENRMRIKENIGRHQGDRISLARNMFDSVPIMRCLFMLQILIAVTQPNLEARQRLFNVKAESDKLDSHAISRPLSRVSSTRMKTGRGEFSRRSLTFAGRAPIKSTNRNESYNTGAAQRRWILQAAKEAKGIAERIADAKFLTQRNFASAILAKDDVEVRTGAERNRAPRRTVYSLRGVGKGHIVVGEQTREVPLAREKFPRVV